MKSATFFCFLIFGDVVKSCSNISSEPKGYLSRVVQKYKKGFKSIFSQIIFSSPKMHILVKLKEITFYIFLISSFCSVRQFLLLNNFPGEQ